jgi:hypothetical protein
MESKKINQLATELAPALSDLTIIGDPTTGISKKITLSQMASLFTGTVEEYANLASFPLVGVADTIYIALDTNVLYRWNTGTNAYVELSPNIINSLVFSDANGFDGTISLVGSVATLTITTALTTGSVAFIGASGALLQDNANFFWDDTNNRLGIGTNAPTTTLDVFGSGIIGRLNGTTTNNAFLGFANQGSNKWSIGNVQSDHRFRIYSETNTSELVSVLQTGEFGIGIANPTTKFHIDGGASALIANLDANVSVAKSISFRSDNSNRINLEVSGTESGSNAGANFFLRTYTDAGSLLETPLSIVRSTGVTTIKSLTLTNALSVGNGGTGATSFNTGQLLFGNGSSAINSTSNLYWDNTNLRLGIRTTGPICDLEVSSSAATPTEVAITNTNASGSSRLSIRNTERSFILTNNTTDDLLSFAYNDANRLQFDLTNQWFNTGNLGVGTNNPDFGSYGAGERILGISNTSTRARLQFQNTATGTTGVSGTIAFFNSTTLLTSIDVIADGATNKGRFVFNTNDGTSFGEKVRIASNGLLSVNETYSSANYKFSVKGASHLTGSNNKGLFITDTASYSSIVGLNKEISAYNAIELRGSGTDYQLYLGTNGNVGINGIAGSNARLHVFGSTAIGDAQSGGDIRLYVSGSTGSQTPGLFNNTNGGSGSENIILFQRANTTVGSITSTNTNTAYNTTSDYRLKEDLQDFDALNLLSKIKFYDFKWKVDEHRMTGVIAHELQEIVPYAVNGEKDAIDKDENEIYQGVDYSKLVAIQGRAIQQLKAEIEILKAK